MENKLPTSSFTSSNGRNENYVSSSNASVLPERVSHHFHPSHSYIHAGSSMPQHLLPFSLSLTKRADDVFLNRKQRRGKWTVEEENYANFLVKEFENGSVPDCENGCTLRAFLSRKLHCAPMRISKKFAGKSIGKHVFIARASSTFSSSAYESRRKLVELEQCFLSSVMNESPLLNYSVADKSSKSTEKQPKSQTIMRYEVPKLDEVKSSNISINLTKINSDPDQNELTENVICEPEKVYSAVEVKSLKHNIFVNNPDSDYPGKKERSYLHNSNDFSHNVMPMSDFLAGFEEINNSKNEDCSGKPSSLPTTKSFDDFHKYLGNNIPSPIGDGIASKAVKVHFSQPIASQSLLITDQGLVEKPISPVSISSDEYARFAQNSSLAVSQHSAYSRKYSQLCRVNSRMNKKLRTSELLCNDKILECLTSPNNLPVVTSDSSFAQKEGSVTDNTDIGFDNTDNENDVSDLEGDRIAQIVLAYQK